MKKSKKYKKEYQRQYRASHHDEIVKNRKEYYATHKEQAKKYNAEFRKTHKEYAKEYYRTHKAHTKREYDSTYYKRHRDRICEQAKQLRKGPKGDALRKYMREYWAKTHGKEKRTVYYLYLSKKSDIALINELNKMSNKKNASNFIKTLLRTYYGLPTDKLRTCSKTRMYSPSSDVDCEAVPKPIKEK